LTGGFKRHDYNPASKAFDLLSSIPLHNRRYRGHFIVSAFAKVNGRYNGTQGSKARIDLGKFGHARPRSTVYRSGDQLFHTSRHRSPNLQHHSIAKFAIPLRATTRVMPDRRDRPTPAWVIIGLLTSFLILILQATLYSTEDPYASFIVSVTYTVCIMFTCFISLLGHLLVRRYPAIARFLNVDIDLGSVMTMGGGRGGREMAEVGSGRRRESIGAWAEETELPPPYAPPRAVTREDLEARPAPTPVGC
jgi:hypothetical protein